MNFKDYPAEDLRTLSKRAGVASGEARREKAAAIERERITNAAMKKQEAINRRQHRENVRTIREMTSLLGKLQREAHGWTKSYREGERIL